MFRLKKSAMKRIAREYKAYTGYDPVNLSEIYDRLEDAKNAGETPQYEISQYEVRPGHRGGRKFIDTTDSEFYTDKEGGLDRDR